MPSPFAPILLKMYVFKKYTVLTIRSGHGIFQVDFKNYSYILSRSIFLAPGQYFQLLSGGYDMHMQELEENEVRPVKNSRFLFTHIMGVGHILNRDTHKAIHDHSHDTADSKGSSAIIDDSIQDWISLNPSIAHCTILTCCSILRSSLMRSIPGTFLWVIFHGIWVKSRTTSKRLLSKN